MLRTTTEIKVNIVTAETAPEVQPAPPLDDVDPDSAEDVGAASSLCETRGSVGILAAGGSAVSVGLADAVGIASFT